MRKINQSEPINEFLNKNIQRKPVSFHMPGHKYGRFFSHRIKTKIFKRDITEIPGADNIKKPEGIIKKSLKQIAGEYGSHAAFYLTNGATSGIHAIIRYASITGRKILLSRDCHISAVSGTILFDVETAYIPSGYENGIPVPVTVGDMKKAVEKNPDACGVLLTSPNYYGKTADIARIAHMVHEKGMFLAVDEAHGAHLKFAGLAHLSGIGYGADMVCHSLHKTLPVYNQGAVFHVCSDIIDIDKIREAVNMLGTTSPSYPLIASMEKAVSYYSTNGKRFYSRLKENILKLKHKLESKTNYKILKTDDFTRIVIKTQGNGFKTAAILHEKYKIDIEAADFNHIICIAAPSNRRSDFKKLLKALVKIKIPDNTAELPEIPGIPEKRLKQSQAYSMKHKAVSVDMAEGCICGTIIVSYPPGTPLICPGENIDGCIVEYIKITIEAGGNVLGVENNKIPVLERT